MQILDGSEEHKKEIFEYVLGWILWIRREAQNLHPRIKPLNLFNYVYLIYHLTY